MYIASYAMATFDLRQISFDIGSKGRGCDAYVVEGTQQKKKKKKEKKKEKRKEKENVIEEDAEDIN